MQQRPAGMVVVTIVCAWLFVSAGCGSSQPVGTVGFGLPAGNDVAGQAASNDQRSQAVEGEPLVNPLPLSIPPDFSGIPTTRGTTGGVLKIGVVGTEAFFAGLGNGVLARVERANLEGGVLGRQIEVVEVIDDGGDPTQTASGIRSLVLENDVFALVLVSGVVDDGALRFLNDNNVPYMGWGFSDAFCDPNWWGFGFNGCLNGHALGIGAKVDASLPQMIDVFTRGSVNQRVVLVTTSDDAGLVAERNALAVWGDALVGTVGLTPNQGPDEIARAVGELQPDLTMLAAPLEQLVPTKAALLASGQAGLVVDESTYLPGLAVAPVSSLQSDLGLAVTQFPSREENSPASRQLSADLQAIGGSPFFTRGNAVGYWSADLLVGLVGLVDEPLTNESFYNTMHRTGVVYDSRYQGGLCPVDSLTVHRNPTGGAALMQVVDARYTTVVPFSCWPLAVAATPSDE